MESNDLLQNFYKAINVTMRTKKRKKIIKNVFNWKGKTCGLHIYK